MRRIKTFEVVFVSAGELPSVGPGQLLARLNNLFPEMSIKVTENHSPVRLVFTDDGAKALVVGEDGRVIHTYILDERGIPSVEEKTV